MKVYSNPYAHLDHLGRLAGIVPESQANRPVHVLPHRRIVGALKPEITPGSYVPDGDGQGNAMGGEWETRMPDVQSTCDLVYRFTVEPFETPEMGGAKHMDAVYYVQRVADGELFEANADGKPPLEKLAAARIKAIADWTAAHGTAPDTSTWLEAYPFDEAVTETAMKLLDQREAEAKAKAEELERGPIAPDPNHPDEKARAAKEAVRKRAAEQSAALSARITGKSAPKPTPAPSGPSVPAASSSPAASSAPAPSDTHEPSASPAEHDPSTQPPTPSKES